MARPDPLARALVESSLELHRRRLWLEVPGDAPFLVRVPGEDLPLVASVMGQAGTEYGLSLLRGAEALSRLTRWISAGSAPRDEMEEVSVLGVTVEPLARIPPQLRKPLEAAGFKARRETLAPSLLAKPAHHVPRAPNRGEMRILLHAVRGVLAAHDAGELVPPRTGRGARKVLEITVEGEGRDQVVRTRTVPVPAAGDFAAIDAPAAAEPEALRGDFSGTPRLAERWIVMLPTLPASVEGEERSLRGLMVLEESSGRILVGDVVLGAGEGEVAAQLAACFRGEGSEGRRGLPREVVFASEKLAGALRPALEALGVSAVCEPDHPAVSEVGEKMVEYSERLGVSERESAARGTSKRRPAVRGPAGREMDPAALPVTLEQWKEADRAFSSRLVYEIEERGLSTTRALARYFGGEDVAAEVLEELVHLSPFGGYVEWLVADYRASARSKTFLEEALREGESSDSRRRSRAAPRDSSATLRGWSAVERSLIEGRLTADVSIYRVDSAEPGATLEVEDVLTGARATVHDRALSGCGVEGFFLPLRLFRAGRFTFAVIAGPAISAFEIEGALERLEELGLDGSAPGRGGAGGTRRSAHVFGRLWELALEREGKLPELRNTDGDPFEWQTASFEVADPAAVARAIESRPDVELDPGDGRWVWSRPGGPVPGFGDTTTLGRLEMIGDRLVVEVNSARRLARAREWIERIPGVRFESSRSRAAFSAEGPLDDRLKGPRPKPMSPELAAQVERVFLERCRAWLDEKIPALGGLTPRDACRSEEGRRRVAVMVRTMPPMTMPGKTVRVPVAELLGELGIGGGGGLRRRVTGRDSGALGRGEAGPPD